MLQLTYINMRALRRRELFGVLSVYGYFNICKIIFWLAGVVGTTTPFFPFPDRTQTQTNTKNDYMNII